MRFKPNTSARAKKMLRKQRAKRRYDRWVQACVKQGMLVGGVCNAKYFKSKKDN